MKKSLYFLLSLLMITQLLMIQLHCAVLNVPDQYITINDAVNASQSGDTIKVGAGTFMERIQLKPSTTLSGSGLDFTILYGEFIGHCIILADNCQVNNMRIMNGDMAIYAKDTTGAKVENCHIETRMHGIWSENSSLEITNNYFYCTYAAIKLIDSPNTFIINNKIEGRYIGLWCENSTGVEIKRNYIKGFLVNVLIKDASPAIFNNAILYASYAGIALIEGSNPQIINNTISGSQYYGICIMQSEPTLLNNIIAYNIVGVDSEDGFSPESSYNIISPNYTANFYNYEGSRSDFLTPALLVGSGYSTDVSEHILVDETAHWKPGILEGYRIIPSVVGDKGVYNGQDREFFVISNTETSLSVFEEYRSSWMYSSPLGMLTSNYTETGDPYLVDNLDYQTTKDGWDENSPAINGGNPDSVYNDPDGSRNDIGLQGGPDAGWIGYQRPPMINSLVDNIKFLTGDLLHLVTFIRNESNLSKVVDIYKVLQYSEDNKIILVFFDNNGNPSSTPIFERRTLSESYRKVDNIFNFTLTGEFPSVNYKFHSALMEPGTSNPICAISTVDFTLTNKPDAKFTVTPTTGKKMTTIFYVDASASTDAEDATAVLQVSWQWEAGFSFTSYSVKKKAQHKYPSSGEKTITLQVMDLDGNVSTTSQTITVTD
ncbi:right-handed parallel beta-helix repeat-containing protein [bacterium]|nr:right-handed parallel beta-helix repeat-containing protein [bacterium]